MKEQTGDSYVSAIFAKSMFLSEAKVGKSCFLIASALGVFPGQKYGGIVDKPENLHVITFDSDALGGVKRFLLETCKAPKEALNFRVYNMQDDLRAVAMAGTDWDFGFYNTFLTTLQTIGERARGVPCVLVSSLTGLAQGVERAIAGPPGKKKGGGMDMSKWSAVNSQINEIRNYAQTDDWHCLWEAHVVKSGSGGQDGEPPKEKLPMHGSAATNFPFNVEQVFRIRRMFGQKVPNTNCEVTLLDTRPSMDFISNGRNFNEALQPKEYDLTLAYKKLGLRVGSWGHKAAPPKTAQPAARQQPAIKESA